MDTSFHISISSLGFYLSPECLLNFLSNFYVPRYSCPSPLKTRLPSSCNHALGKRKLLIPPGSILSKICFPQHQKRVEETLICFIKIQS